MSNGIESIEIEEIENYLSYIRPEEEIRNEVDIAYKIENQSVIIYDIRPSWTDKSKKIETEIAKATFVKKENHWKVYWQKSDQKWHAYKPNPIVPNLLDFIRLIEKDEHYCFWG